MKSQDSETEDPRLKYTVMMYSTQTWKLCKKMTRSLKPSPPNTILRRRLGARITILVHLAALEESQTLVRIVSEKLRSSSGRGPVSCLGAF